MFNKQQRREIYTSALKRTVKINERGDGSMPFMCHSLSFCFSGSITDYRHDDLLKLFPEWANVRPEGFVYNGVYSNIWEDVDTKYYDDTEFGLLRETILCLALAQL